MSGLTVTYKVRFGRTAEKQKEEAEKLASTLVKSQPAPVARQLALAYHVEQLVEDGVIKNYAEAARLLQTTPRIIGYKLRKFGIDPASYRSSSRPSWEG